jgi:LAO/AO transport system kinase
MELSQSVLSGDRLALARLLSRVENDTPEGRKALDALFPHTGRAHLLGITGAPGTGKSSLVNQLALHFRKSEKRVAIVAVDPSSPFTGGAVLGDRVRMRDLAGDAGVFIRSMATRGSLGGLAAASAAVTQVFDAAGFDVIMIETVGAGQSEVDIARLAHTTIVVEAPGLGDEIQAIKAGIMEIADILVINKADRPGVESTERALKTMLDLAHPVRKVFMHHGQAVELNGAERPDSKLWIPPVQRTVATEGKGLPELLEAIERHVAHLRSSGDWARRGRARLEAEFDLLLQEALVARFLSQIPPKSMGVLLESIQNREISPREAIEHLLSGSKG